MVPEYTCAVTPSVLSESPIFSSLPESLPLRRYGYQVLRHGGPLGDYAALKERFRGLIQDRLGGFLGGKAPELTCETYHDALVRLGADHHAFIKATTRRIPSDWSSDPYLVRLVEEAGRQVGKRLRIFKENLEYRVVRPGQSDNNPWHRDHWFSYFVPLVNVYLPLSGSYCDSSLQIVPFSHLWDDEECTPTFKAGESKTEKGGVRYSVPELKSCAYEIKGHRMDIVPGDFALFSPRMIHGEGSNSSLETRFSMEFRLEVQP